MPILQFAPFSSLVQPSLWHKLSDLKIDVLKLSDVAVPITGSYSIGRTVIDRETGQEITLPCNLTVGTESFDTHFKPPHGSVSAHGTLKNYNTIEEFKAADKTALFNQEAQLIWDHILKTRDTSQLNRFFVITFADLKKYKYYYWFAFPAFVSKPAWEIHEDGWKNAEEEIGGDTLSSIHSQLRSHNNPLPYFLLKQNEGNIVVSPVEEYEQFYASTPHQERTIGFVDPSSDPHNPGWPLRNLLAYLRALYPEATSTIRILRWRDTEIPSPNSTWKSQIGLLTVEGAESKAATETTLRPSAVGWEKNPQGKLGPRVADLAPMMDPSRLASQAVDLNLKLMRWRILPSLDLDKISSTRCLLLGAGTLGCYVARALMGWGVRTITFVDSGKVSFSNPVRQPLFEFSDCLEGGKPKAEAAAEALKRIFPGINATGHTISIPMPGHPISSNAASMAQAIADVAKMEKLIDDHDAVFLLMDSRESRWLPTVISASKGKIVLNAALGFDSYLVMRHGARASSLSIGKDGKPHQKLGCYYCNDIVAPADSLTDRTLDQMCTVTRPGLAPIAAATAVELLASLLQHPDRLFAPAPPPNTNNSSNSEPDEGLNGVLGVVPHQLRGFLGQFKTMPLVGAAYDRCTGCSETVLKAYETRGFSMLLEAFNDAKYLETLTGLDKLYSEGDELLESVDWHGDDDEEDDF
ncbi:Ubiquitin-like modifier-activating enzyme ATG7 [Psilocybe cubensis]|uniref:Ubiquitin-like modifier-activating enzyme ATG7 n=1 Tax=Psilocybe cubensis TaxID=181762 RepID=A0ACB8GYZ3_PSICU|nr:Ubiquitin-like modifier-activating enzyme ATG7 [Psilocybe cubensis]KAH9480647.1 Ubiquitin-like modifier-activating enzyme ATG7 [Psilocybe cubensis]